MVLSDLIERRHAWATIELENLVVHNVFRFNGQLPLSNIESGADGEVLTSQAGEVVWQDRTPKKGYWQASVINTVPDGYRLIFQDEVYNSTGLSFDVAGEELSGFDADKLYHLEFKTNIEELGPGDEYVLGISKDGALPFLDSYEQAVVAGEFKESVTLQLVSDGADLAGSYLEFRFDGVLGDFDATKTSLIVTELYK